MKILLLLKMLLLPRFQVNLLSPSSGSKMQEDVPMNVGNYVGVLHGIITQQTIILIFITVKTLYFINDHL